MQAAKSSALKINVFAVVFCVFAGFTYGTLWSAHCPISPFGIGLLSFGNAAMGSSLIFLLWSVFTKQRLKSALLLMFGSWIAASLIIAFVSQERCFKGCCGLHVRVAEDLQK